LEVEQDLGIGLEVDAFAFFSCCLLLLFLRDLR
jgi:hypothetical protein